MNYEESWKVLADLLTELRRKGVQISDLVMNDLRSAKIMMGVLKADPTRIANIPRIETYLRNVESYAISMAQQKLGTESVDRWLRKLENAKKVKTEEKTKMPDRFIPGLPRNREWVRVEISKDMPEETVERLAQENKLSSRRQKNGYILVYGDEKSIKSFVKKMASELHSKRKE